MTEDSNASKMNSTLKNRPKSDPEVVEVMVLSGFERVLSYRMPPDPVHPIQVGSLVRIPLLNRREMGIVTRMESRQVMPADKLKMLSGPVQPYPVLSPDLMKLFHWIRHYYAATPESIFETMIPRAIRKGMKPKTGRYISKGEMPKNEALQALVRRAPKQAALLEFMARQKKPLARARVLSRFTAGVLNALIAKGFLRETEKEETRVAYRDRLGLKETGITAIRPNLTEEQASAVKSIVRAIEEGVFSVRLLHGVTGSGKTEVYLSAIEQIVAPGGGVIILVPEVALAPQTVGQVRDRLEARGVSTVVWHSHLSEGERYDAWKALVSRQARVVVGARSAVFAPVHNLKLIIVDEEHEPSYKQDTSPRYNGRDVAVYRAWINQSLCVLGSATPSLESLYNVERGKYGMDRMFHRVDNRQLPKIHLVDMRRESIQRKGTSAISGILADKLIDRFEKKEQSILFLNRRGFSTSMQCPNCGFVATCEHCSVPMTYHITDKKLRCHLCNQVRSAPSSCPQCRSPDIRRRGVGTQKIEETVQKILPQAKIVRMDADSMSKKNLYREILNNFRIGKIDLLIGTQMIAKGLDFPNVTLVGLVDADRSLHVEDFRAAERTFQLIVQVAGRSGRGDRAGEVIIQTHTPHAEPIQFARKSDFDGFQLEELAQRREFNYPPFRHLIRHLFRGRNPDKVDFYMKQWLKVLEKSMEGPIEIRGPAPAPIEKISGEYRFQFWYFVPGVSRVIGELTALRNEFFKNTDQSVIDLIDVDPMNLS